MPAIYRVHSSMERNDSLWPSSAGNEHSDNSSRLIAMGSEVDIPGDFQEALISKWSILVPLVLLISVTFVGNGTVILMFVRTKRLRNFKYNFIASLAVADFLIGCTEPVSLLETVTGRWPHGLAQCKIFLVIRYSLYYVSFLSILLISVDRWCSIYHPFSYRVKQSKRLAIWTIVFAWILSFIIHGTPIVVWDYFDRYSRTLHWPSAGQIETNNSVPFMEDKLCAPPYQRDVAFLTLSVILENLLPLVALAVLNLSVYVKILRRKSTKIRRSLSTSDSFFHLSRKSSSDSEAGLPEEERDVLETFLKTNRKDSLYRAQQERRHSISHTLMNSSIASRCRQANNSKRRVSFDATMLSQQNILRKKTVPPGAAAPGTERRRSTGDELLRDLFLRQDKKAACALGLLVVVFVVCWAPHCIVSIIRASCFHCIPQWLVTLTHWILAANSAINPFLYAIGNSEFRKVLKSLGGCDDKELNRKRENCNILNSSYYLLVP